MMSTQIILTEMANLRWLHVDVFSNGPLSGNAVAVFPDAGRLSSETMLALTQELRVFEAIFLSDEGPGGPVSARIFTAEEELTFAGHPILGAAVCLQNLRRAVGENTYVFKLDEREVSVTVTETNNGYVAEMDQGTAELGPLLSAQSTAPLLDCLSLAPHHLPNDLKPVMATTGLPYIIVPVKPQGLAQARIHGTGLEAELARFGGKFVYVLDVENHEGRSWDNLGRVEDIATGSAAGPAAAYLWKYCGASSALTLAQGKFAGRPSSIRVRRDESNGHILVSGEAIVLAEGRFL